MPRRKSFGFGPKRKSYKSPGMRVNTKGYRLTSVSYGGKGARVNVSKRGTKLNGKSCMLTLLLMTTLFANVAILAAKATQKRGAKSDHL